MSIEGSDSEHSARPLSGLTVAVTRPAHQAEATAQALADAGAAVVRFPVLAIEAFADLPVPPRCDLMVFVSANAVQHGLSLLAAQVGPPAQVAAVGRATAAALERAGVGVDVCPASGFDSEALLATDALQQVAGRTVLIVRGQGGRELLADTLRARGAKVHYAEVYRRVCSQPDASLLDACWQAGRPGLVSATSSDGLRCLLDALDPDRRRRLLSTPLAVIGERMLKQARNMGFQSEIVVTEPGDQALITALGTWHASTNQE